MPVDIEIISTQKFEEHEETEKNQCKGNIEYHENGDILEYTEKYEEMNLELNFKMTILKEKIITKRNNQTMVFDLKNKNSTTLDTPYGALNMVITTNKIEVLRQDKEIKKIVLEYQIELEQGMTYDNIVEIIINNH